MNKQRESGIFELDVKPYKSCKSFIIIRSLKFVYNYPLKEKNVESELWRSGRDENIWGGN